MNCQSIKKYALRSVGAILSLFTLGSSAWAQSVSSLCEISLSYAGIVISPVGESTPVPSLTMLGVGILGAIVAAIAWRLRHKSVMNQLFSAMLMSAGIILCLVSDDSLINQVRAAGPYEFTSPTGGSVVDNQIAGTASGPIITVTNTSGRRIKITANANPAEAGTCNVNSEIAAGASCTAQAFACHALPVIKITGQPAISCDYSKFTAYPNIDPAFSSLNFDFAVYDVMMNVMPVYDTSSVTTSFSYTPNATSVVYDPVSHFATNRDDMGSGIGVVSATAPVGFVFDNGLNTMSWNLPYTKCWSSP